MNHDRFDPGPPAEVASHADGNRWTLVFVRDVRHPPGTVWAALTDPGQLRAWAPFVADRDLGQTGDATLTMVDGDVAEDLPATVTRAEPPTLLEYTWGDDLLRWELTPTERGTRLTLRHTVEHRSMVPKVAAGWHLCLVVAERLLDGAPVGPIRGEDARNYGWDDLRDAYAARLGIDASSESETSETPEGR
jgi:uncharacterized protein YndB with AHSA1/START domain